MSGPLTRATAQLTHEGATVALQAAIAEATRLGVPQNISVVDAGGHLITFARMDGARLYAHYSSLSKAQTAASLGDSTGHLPPQFGVDLALATGGRSINMVGGLPIVVDGLLVGAVGVSSGTDEQDLAVAEAARAAVLVALQG